MIMFWDAAPCSLVEDDRSFRQLSALIIRVMSNVPDDGGSKHLLNLVSCYHTTVRSMPEDSLL
jgi:hypothetical protein